MPHTFSRLGAFFCPPVTPPQLVEALVSALDADESRVIRLPAYSHLARFTGVSVGIVPKWLIDLVQWVTRADWGMAEYGPKPDAAEKLLEGKARLSRGPGTQETSSMSGRKKE